LAQVFVFSRRSPAMGSSVGVLGQAERSCLTSHDTVVDALHRDKMAYARTGGHHYAPSWPLGDRTAPGAEGEGNSLRHYATVGAALRADQVHGLGFRLLEPGTSEPFNCVCAVGNNSFAVAGEEGVAVLYDVSTGKVAGRYSNQNQAITALASCGQRLLAAGDSNGSVLIWDLPSAALRTHWTMHDENISAIHIDTHKGWLYAASWDEFITVFDLEKAHMVSSLAVVARAHQKHPALCLDFSRDHRAMYQGGANCKLSTWDLTGASMRVVQTFELDAPVNSVAILPDENHLVAGADHNLFVLDRRMPSEIVQQINLPQAYMDTLTAHPHSLFGEPPESVYKRWSTQTAGMERVVTSVKVCQADAARVVAVTRDGLMSSCRVEGGIVEPLWCCAPPAEGGSALEDGSALAFTEFTNLAVDREVVYSSAFTPSVSVWTFESDDLPILRARYTAQAGQEPAHVGPLPDDPSGMHRLSKTVEAIETACNMDAMRLQELADYDQDGDKENNARVSERNSQLLMEPPCAKVARAPMQNSGYLSLEHMRAMFRDIDTDGSGSLDVEEIRDYLSANGFTEDEIEGFINYTDRDGSGTLEWPEFKAGYKLLNPVACKSFLSYHVVRKPGSVDGQPFRVESCFSCRIFICDITGGCVVANNANCEILIGPSWPSVMISDCKYCTLYVAAHDVQLKNCQSCKVFMLTPAPPIMQYCRRMEFGPWNASYPRILEQFKEAGLLGVQNQWCNPVDLDVRGNAVARGMFNWSPMSVIDCHQWRVKIPEIEDTEEACPCPALDMAGYSEACRHLYTSYGFPESVVAAMESSQMAMSNPQAMASQHSAAKRRAPEEAEEVSPSISPTRGIRANNTGGATL